MPEQHLLHCRCQQISLICPVTAAGPLHECMLGCFLWLQCVKTELPVKELGAAGSAITSDVRFCSAHEPEGQFRHVLPRQHDVEYDVEPRGDHFFIEIRQAHCLLAETTRACDWQLQTSAVRLANHPACWSASW